MFGTGYYQAGRNYLETMIIELNLWKMFEHFIPNDLFSLFPLH